MGIIKEFQSDLDTGSSRCIGGGVYMTGGNVLDCTFANCAAGGCCSKGAGVYMEGGIVSNCTVAGNDPGSAKSPVVTMADGTLVNTVIWGNNASQQLKKTGGTVSYCWFPGGDGCLRQSACQAEPA